MVMMLMLHSSTLQIRVSATVSVGSRKYLPFYLASMEEWLTGDICTVIRDFLRTHQSHGTGNRRTDMH